MLSTIYTISRIQQIVGASGNITDDSTISNLLTDSRKINNPTASLFFALSDRRDGHDFIPEVYKAGVHNFVVKHVPEDITEYPKANFLVVNNVLKALQKLAAHHRKQFDLEVIGITGSNGKT